MAREVAQQRLGNLGIKVGLHANSQHGGSDRHVEALDPAVHLIESGPHVVGAADDVGSELGGGEQFSAKLVAPAAAGRRPARWPGLGQFPFGVLNEYLSDMTSIVFQHQGTLDKYIGDAVMAFWGAPYEELGHAVRACNTALEMMKHVRKMQKKWEAEGKPHLDIGIGLNTGVASVGNMGSGLRYGYTALGDTVNLSSRLEGLNKEYGTHILANETAYQSAKEGGFVFRELDLIRVKGKLQPVTIYELVGLASELGLNGGGQDLQARLGLFTHARDLYRKRQWDEAQSAFESILVKWPGDGPSRTYWKRCQEYLFEEPSANWDGVFTMTSK